MKKNKNTTRLRIIIGIVVIIHGLMRVAFINDYVDFVLHHFDDLSISDDLLMISATFLPFLEFLIGAFILCKIGVKKSLILALLISLLMIVFIILGNLHYTRLIYHIVIVGGIMFLLNMNQATAIIDFLYKLSKGKIYPGRN